MTLVQTLCNAGWSPRHWERCIEQTEVQPPERSKVEVLGLPPPMAQTLDA
jgi:hypothetical protein